MGSHPQRTSEKGHNQLEVDWGLPSRPPSGLLCVSESERLLPVRTREPVAGDASESDRHSLAADTTGTRSCEMSFHIQFRGDGNEVS